MIESRTTRKDSWRGTIIGAANCSVNTATRYSNNVERYETVDSVRGKPQYLHNGKKRVRKHNPFQRYLWEAYQGNQHICNPKNGKYDVANYDSVPTNFWSPDNAYGALVSRPGQPALISPESLHEYGAARRDYVIRDLFAKANAPRFKSAVSLAELDETLVGIRDLLRGALSSLLKADKGMKVLKHFSLNSEELWLWYRYALMPAILEATDLINALQHYDEKDLIQDGDLYEDTLTGSFDNNGWFGYYDTTWTWKGSLKCRCGGKIDMLKDLSRYDFGMGPADVVAAGWERIPFSFVADWFVNLGDWLASLRPSGNLFLQSYATFALDIKYEFSCPQWIDQGGEPPYLHVFLMDRNIDIEPPSLPLIDRHWANVLRTVDLISLVVGALKRVLNKRRH